MEQKSSGVQFEEKDRRAFVKTFKPTSWMEIKWILPHLERLERAGLVAETVAIREEEEKVSIYMEKVNGYDVNSLPDTLKEYKMSLLFAQRLAGLFQGFCEIGYYHDDPNGGNVMYDILKDRIVAVDLDSIVINKGDIPLRKYVRDFCYLLSEIYLGFHPIDEMVVLLSRGELANYMPTTWEEFSKNDPQKMLEDWERNGVDQDFADLLEMFSYEPTWKLLEEVDLIDELNPQIVNFILRGLNPATCPESFDQIFSLGS